MKTLGLQELLRYATSGGIGLAVLVLAFPEVKSSIGPMETGQETTLVVGLVLLIGTLIYNLHRALIYPIIFRIVGLISLPRHFSWRLLNPWQPSDVELKVDRWRWENSDERRRRWDEWGAQTHSLYCAAWAILAALLLGRHEWTEPNSHAQHIFWGLFGVTLMAGLASNYRILYSMAGDMKANTNTTVAR